MEKQRVIAVDFDGCLCDNAYPDIGAPNWQVIDAALKERADGAALILWTCRACREGDMLQQALDACKGWGLEFDAVNGSLPKWKETWKNDPRKIGATEYWDDKAVRMPNIDPVTAAAEALGMSPDRLRELAQAEKEGRLVVLPCDVGDKLYDVTLGEVREKIVISLSMLLSKSVNHLVIHAENFRSAVTSYELQDIGKTVFLTREAAEAALKEREAEHEQTD